jgi:XrtJ-associated TM-motif-TM protein
MKKFQLFAIAALLLMGTRSLYAATGCVDSPENPTAILALVGSAGAFIVSARGRFGRRRK